MTVSYAWMEKPLLSGMWGDCLCMFQTRSDEEDAENDDLNDAGESSSNTQLFCGEQTLEMMGEIRAFPNLLLPFLDGGNLHASSIDMEAEDEAVIEAEPARPKRKLITTLQVIIGVTDLASFNPGPLSMSSSPPCSRGETGRRTCSVCWAPIIAGL